MPEKRRKKAEALSDSLWNRHDQAALEAKGVAIGATDHMIAAWMAAH